MKLGGWYMTFYIKSRDLFASVIIHYRDSSIRCIGQSAGIVALTYR